MNESLAYLSPQCAGNAFNFGEKEKKYKKNDGRVWGRAFTTSFRNPRNVTSCVQEVYKKG